MQYYQLVIQNIFTQKISIVVTFHIVLNLNKISSIKKNVYTQSIYNNEGQI